MISNGETTTVKRMFEQNNLHPEVMLNKFEWTPLHTAAYKGHKDLVIYFLKLGARAQMAN